MSILFSSAVRNPKRWTCSPVSDGEAESARRFHRVTLQAFLLLTVMVAAVGCNKNSPTAPQNDSPSGPVDASGHLYGTVFILGSGGKCLPGATIAWARVHTPSLSKTAET